MVIKPDAIPQFSGDLGAVETQATALNAAGSDFRLTGQEVHSTWQGLSAFYEAPEAATLFGATVRVRNDADTVSDDVQEVASALTQYVQVMRPIVARLSALQSEARTFVAGIDGDDDWRSDEGKVNQNNDLIRQVDTQLAAMMAAERQAANRINRLFGGTQWVVGDGSGNPNAYGFDAGALPAEAERPWGTSEERDLPWYQDGWNFVVGDYKGFFVDGLWGDVTGLFGLVNFFDWDTFSASWGGLWTLTGGVFTDPAKTGEAWKEFGKGLVAWDTWSEDPGRAFGLVVYNVFTLPLAPAKVGALGKGGKAAGAVAEGGADAAKAAEAARLTAAGKVLDEFGDVADVGKVDSLPTVADLATQVDLHLGDVLKANPDLQRALQDADALARVEAPARVDAPEARTRVDEPALVGAGRNGGTDLAPPRTGGGADLPPPRTGGGDGPPPRVSGDGPPPRVGGGDGADAPPPRVGGGGGGIDAPAPRTGDGAEVPTLRPGDGAEVPTPRTGDGGELPGGPGRDGEPGLPDTPGRTGDPDPLNPGRTVDDPPGPDRDAQDAPANPADDDPTGRPGDPADDGPGAPDRSPEQPAGDRTPGDVRADLDATGRDVDSTTDTGRDVDDTTDGRAADEAGQGAGDGSGGGRAADDGAGRADGDTAGGSRADDTGTRPLRPHEDPENPGHYKFAEDVTPAIRDTRYGRTLYEGPDGKWHADGDSMTDGSSRRDNGQLVDSRGHFLDDNNRPKDGIDAPSVVDTANKEKPLKLPKPELQDDLARDVQAKLDARTKLGDDMRSKWDTDLAEIVKKINGDQEFIEAGFKIDPSTMSSDLLKEAVVKAEDLLSTEELFKLENSGKEWLSLRQQYSDASERLGAVGGNLLEDRMFPGSQRLTGGDLAKGTPGNFDRILLDKDGKLVIIEEKGPRADLGSARATDPNKPDAPKIKAEQGSPEYLREILSKDEKLAKALEDEPELRELVEKAVRENNVRYLVARTTETGTVTVKDFVLDAQRWHPWSASVKEF
ncbi:hypothetical protein [Actinoplanes auranticolor]|uniref:Uncharacterized protein n=1 Tax=Actinoplanes auranticolor TaxID=47988 RepID=A0A919VK22_9ACTN|nr:hypothetical protein [Actinoplanes auranticolor]GIM66117.1 hypothetical protein Aau02nite_21750 [Actinoplanes auranticolor]